MTIALVYYLRSTFLLVNDCRDYHRGLSCLLVNNCRELDYVRGVPPSSHRFVALDYVRGGPVFFLGYRLSRPHLPLPSRQ